MKRAAARRLLAPLALCAAAALSACAGGSGNTTSSGDLKTASDQTLDEKRAGIRMQLAIGYYQDRKYDVALDEIKQAIAANPDSADAHGVRALIYSSMGETALADQSYQRALQLAPRNPELANNYGSFLCQNGRAEQGIALFESALKNPVYQSPVNALLNAGSCSLRAGKLDAAERYLLDALRYDAALPATNGNLAQVYFERHDIQRAGFFLNRLREAAKIDILPAETLWLAIRIDRKLGDKSSEASMVSQLRRRFPASPEYAEYQRGAFNE
ncbi:type IV pilus biogenesis/stability protein PilW [Massilia sp. RP-1-19]|uniref:Type IV pilus biogenesis/stability protein PilW n=1 Tax=Massilia polaris TaxID=2728846 RepID=A0A848HF19_9BURK|nr:type IV pilus biogenesis/stability protein PilW [Massilia polaris]NML59542.1 type IV pilus biogenesis/stability protein PilW [Massilia polaris]